jgi:hypothetical protein
MGCTACERGSLTQVSINSPTAGGMDCAVRALRGNDFYVEWTEADADATVQAEAASMGLRARQGGFDVYVLKLGTPNTCADIQQFAPDMRRAVEAISSQCSGATLPTHGTAIPVRDCDVRLAIGPATIPGSEPSLGGLALGDGEPRISVVPDSFFRRPWRVLSLAP